MTAIDDLTSTAFVLKALIQESKDGEWGKGEPSFDSVKMAVIRGTDFEAVRNGNIDALPIRYIPKRIADRKTLQANDILLETAGGSKDRPTGRSLFIKSSIIHRSELPLTCASFSRFIRIDPTKADPRYIFWHLQYLYDADYLRQYHTQHTGVARFQYTVFSEREELLIPLLLIQRKIAAILSAYDDLIENNTRRIEILEEMARSLYREWFVNFRFPGHEQVKMVNSELGLIPEGWEVKKIDKLGLLGRGKSKHRPRNEPSLYGGNYPFIQTGEVKEASLYITHYSQTYNEKGLAQSKLWEPKTLLLTIAANIAETAILTIPACFPDSIVGFVADSEQVTPEFIKYRIDDIKEKMQSFSRGTAQDNLSLDKIKLFDFLVPNKDCIRLFENYAAPLFSQIQNLLLKNANLRQTRDLLLRKLISGEIDVKKLNINTGEIAA